MSKLLASHRRLVRNRATYLATILGATLNWRGTAALAVPAVDQTAHHGLSTLQCRRSILVGAHSVLRGTLKLRTLRLLGSGRMDNLLKDHS